MTTEEKIEHNKQVEQERAAYHKRRCEESEAYKRVYERMMNNAMRNAYQAQSVENAIQAGCQQIASQMPNLTEQQVRTHEDVMAEREAMKYGLQRNPNYLENLMSMWFLNNMGSDDKLRNEFFEDTQALKEISEVEATYDRQLQRFDKYEL